MSLRETNDAIQSGDFLYSGKCFQLLWLFSDQVEIAVPLSSAASPIQPAVPTVIAMVQCHDRQLELNTCEIFFSFSYV